MMMKEKLMNTVGNWVFSFIPNSPYYTMVLGSN